MGLNEIIYSRILGHKASGPVSLLDVIDVEVSTPGSGHEVVKHRAEKFDLPSLFVTSRRNFVAETKP